MSATVVAKQAFLALYRLAPRSMAVAFLPLAQRYGLRLSIGPAYTDVVSGKRVIRISHRHPAILPDILRAFDYYYSAVSPVQTGGMALVDYSSRAQHHVTGYSLHPVWFPSTAEPLATTTQYLEFAQLKDGDVVLDLGAYAGLTSIVFDQAVGPSGRVVAVDADDGNVACARLNLALYQAATGRSVELLHAAIWERDGELAFSSEGSMGSAATEIVGPRRARTQTVRAVTMRSLAKLVGLNRVDFVKVDVEGAEAVLFGANAFFEDFRPRMIVEAHEVRGRLTVGACREALEGFGYRCNEVSQAGTTLPLLECVPA